MTATLHSMPLSAWLPLQSAAGAFRDECSSLEQLAQELLADLERLGQELESKADELEQGRQRLAERGRQLAEQRKESARLSHQLEQQETQLNEALGELRTLRSDLASRAEPIPIVDSSGELASLRQQVTELQVERGVLQARWEAAQSNPLTSTELASLKQEILQQQESQHASAMVDLRELRAELGRRAEAPVGEDPESASLRQQLADLQVERAVLRERLEASADKALPTESRTLSPEVIESLTDKFAPQFLALHERIQALQHDPPEATELDSLKQERMELEVELELVRARSAELQETVSRQKRELSAQRLEVNTELKELRTLLSQQAEMFSQHEPASSPERLSSHEAVERHSTPLPAAEEPSAKPLDPVVNSVMAQFAKLQRDIAQRRKKK